MPRHVLSPRYEHTRGIKGYVTYYLACYVRLKVQNMPYVLYEVASAKHAWMSLEKIWMEQMGRLEEKIAVVLLY
jgi:hypothetical protein